MTIESFCASCPVDDAAWWPLELSCPAWPDPIRLVQSHNPDGEQFTLETGETVTFQSSGMAISLPDRTARGNQDLSFQLDGVSGEALAAIESALEAWQPVTATLRCYLDSDRSAPARQAVVMTVTSCSATIRSIVCSAGFADFTNAAFPVERFTATNAPGVPFIS